MDLLLKNKLVIICTSSLLLFGCSSDSSNEPEITLSLKEEQKVEANDSIEGVWVILSKTDQNYTNTQIKRHDSSEELGTYTITKNASGSYTLTGCSITLARNLSQTNNNTYQSSYNAEDVTESTQLIFNTNAELELTHSIHSFDSGDNENSKMTGKGIKVSHNIDTYEIPGFLSIDEAIIDNQVVDSTQFKPSCYNIVKGDSTTFSVDDTKILTLKFNGLQLANYDQTPDDNYQFNYISFDGKYKINDDTVEQDTIIIQTPESYLELTNHSEKPNDNADKKEFDGESSIKDNNASGEFSGSNSNGLLKASFELNY